MARPPSDSDYDGDEATESSDGVVHRIRSEPGEPDVSLSAHHILAAVRQRQAQLVELEQQPISPDPNEQEQRALAIADLHHRIARLKGLARGLSLTPSTSAPTKLDEASDADEFDLLGTDASDYDATQPQFVDEAPMSTPPTPAAALLPPRPPAGVRTLNPDDDLMDPYEVPTVTPAEARAHVPHRPAPTLNPRLPETEDQPLRPRKPASIWAKAQAAWQTFRGGFAEWPEEE